LHRRDHPSRGEYLEVDADATIESIIAPLGMPPALVKLVLLNRIPAMSPKYKQVRPEMRCPTKVSGQSGRALPSLAGICLRRAPTKLNGSTAHPNSAPRPVGADTIAILGELG
jgi:hypothetical protein